MTASYDNDGTISVITLDDSKANALSPAMQASIGGALDQAEDAAMPVVLAGRPGIFSAGFDLKVLNAGGPDAGEMLIGGFELALRLLSFPTPVVIASTGHAIAMGSFLLLSADYRVGATGACRVQANEVQLGMTMPHSMVELMRFRLTPPAFNTALTLSEAFAPDAAVAAGWLDRVAEPDAVVDEARAVATAAAGLNAAAHRATKLRGRAPVLTAMRAAIDLDRTELGP